MHRWSRLVGALLVALSFSSLAQASALSLNPSTLSVTISTLPPVTIPSNPATIVVSSGSGTFIESAFVFGPTTVGIPRSLFTGVSLISGLTLAGVGNGTKFCTSTFPNLNCDGGLSGLALVNVIQLFDLTIPLSVVGSPGASVRVSSGGIIITVLGQGWTAGVASVTGISTTFGSTTVFSTGTDQRTASHGGTLVLVSGFKAITNVVGTVPGFVVQTLSFAPEPVEVLLLGIGLAGFGAYGWLRKKRR